MPDRFPLLFAAESPHLEMADAARGPWLPWPEVVELPTENLAICK